MWISQRQSADLSRESAAETGLVTLGGDPACVYLEGERRLLPVYGPGGVQWLPQPGDQVLVLKAGSGRESPCLVGRRQDGQDGLQPGETALSGGGARLLLSGGKARLSGGLTIDGKELEDVIREIVQEMLPGGGLPGGEGGES